jgi:hypothetical protein
MKLRNMETELELDGIDESVEFGLLFNAKMAKMLSDGVYSDKIQSIIREISCNAVDSHVAAGKGSLPIEVHLPSRMEPWFHVKDFGVGMDHETVKCTYSIYGASTKIHSDEFIGQLGLGSKAPICYVDAFDVTSIHDGVEYQYSIHKNQRGIPTVSTLGRRNTNESNGVTVKLPVKQEDINLFATKAQQVFQWFKVAPRVVGVTGFELSPVGTPVYQGTGWRILSRQRGQFALMGQVAYPLDRHSISGLSAEAKTLFNLPLVLDFEIGDLEFAISREALGYDDRTQQQIRLRLETVLKELATRFETKISSAPTEWEARQRFGKIFNGEYRYTFSSIFSNLGLSWKNKIIKSSSVELDLCKIWPKVDTYPLKTNNWGQAASVYRRVKDTNTVELNCQHTTMLVFEDLEKGTMSRMQNYIKTQPGATCILYFENTGRKTRDQILDLLGNPPYKMASQLEKKPSQRTTRTKLGMLRFTGRNGLKAWSDETVDLSRGGIYVRLNRWDVLDHEGNPMEAGALSTAVQMATELGILDEDQAIHAPRDKLKTQLPKMAGWQDLWDVLGKGVDQLITDKAIQSVADALHFRQLLSTINNLGDSRKQMWKHPWDIANKKGAFGQYISGMRHLDQNNRNVGTNETLIRLMEMLSRSFRLPPPSVDGEKLYNDMMARYPMINMLCGTAYTYHLDSIYKDPFKSQLTDYIDQCDHIHAAGTVSKR